MHTKKTKRNDIILLSAKKEFLTYGYADSSLRRICKQAGVTTGALYKRYSGKEELFGKLIAPTLNSLAVLVQEHVRQDYALLEKGRPSQMWEESEAYLRQMMSFIYDHEDGLRLLLFKSEGSRYANFKQAAVASVTEETYHYVKQVHERSEKKAVLISKQHLELVMRAYFTIIFEPLLYGWTKEEALLFCRTIDRLFNWSEILGF
ncbi:TetR/AcrR family transcriptional regulator [Streptococcus sp. H31]|uniref:TetR/AcrR family transcriptional regulator n=1 Tax=Streptococcus huangxiaojuni TaxID=3237239 RepID=UPI0034A1668C